MIDLKGKKAIVTGGGRGLGKAVALSLMAEGVSVAITGRNEDTMKGTWADVPMFIGAHDFEDLMFIIQ